MLRSCSFKGIVPLKACWSVGLSCFVSGSSQILVQESRPMAFYPTPQMKPSPRNEPGRSQRQRWARSTGTDRDPTGLDGGDDGLTGRSAPQNDRSGFTRSGPFRCSPPFRNVPPWLPPPAASCGTRGRCGFFHVCVIQPEEMVAVDKYRSMVHRRSRSLRKNPQKRSIPRTCWSGVG